MTKKNDLGGDNDRLGSEAKMTAEYNGAPFGAPEFLSHSDPAFEPAEHTESRMKAASHALGAVISLGLVAGLGIWSYNLVQKDVTAIPVVQALGYEMRVQPENPGGQQSAHQGLAVNEVAADQGAAGRVDQVTLAPRPLDLADEDAPLPALAASGQTGAEIVPASASAADLDALVAELSQGVTPLGEAGGEVTPAVVSGPGVARSLRPQSRPLARATGGAQIVRAAATAPAPAPATQTPAVPAGTPMVQLGAFDSDAIARSEWSRLSGRFGGYFQDKSPVVQLASSNGRQFYRLRVLGFDGMSDARRLCSALVAEGADCIPVEAR